MGVSESKVELRKVDKKVAVETTEILASDYESDGEIVRRGSGRRVGVSRGGRRSIGDSGGSGRKIVCSREAGKERLNSRETGRVFVDPRKGEIKKESPEMIWSVLRDPGTAGRRGNIVMNDEEDRVGRRHLEKEAGAMLGLETVLRRGGATVFSVSSLETLSSLPSTEEIFSELSFPLKGQPDITKRPLIQNINSKIELLDEGLSDQEVTFDEFSSPSESSDESSSEEMQSEEASIESLLSSCQDQNGSEKSETSLSVKSRLFFNKEFIQNFKERYSNTKSQNKNENVVDFPNEGTMKHNDYEDSFTEITNMLPNDTNKKIIPPKSNIQYSEDTSFNKINPMKCSNESLTYNSLKGSEISRIKQVRSMPTSKLDISSHSYLNKTSNSLSAEIEKSKPGFKSLCYKFWVDATFDTWKVFHNPRDRRIESIGRMSSCQIRLTKITQRSPKGMLKRQVYVYSSCLSALEKCCKLFDDKFPYFCASAGLNIETSVSDRV